MAITRDVDPDVAARQRGCPAAGAASTAHLVTAYTVAIGEALHRLVEEVTTTEASSVRWGLRAASCRSAARTLTAIIRSKKSALTCSTGGDVGIAGVEQQPVEVATGFGDALGELGAGVGIGGRWPVVR